MTDIDDVPYPHPTPRFGFTHNGRYLDRETPKFIHAQFDAEYLARLGCRPHQGWFARYEHRLQHLHADFTEHALLNAVLTHKAQSHTRALRADPTYLSQHKARIFTKKQTKQSRVNNEKLNRCPLCPTHEPGNQHHLHTVCPDKPIAHQRHQANTAI